MTNDVFCVQCGPGPHGNPPIGTYSEYKPPRKDAAGITISAYEQPRGVIYQLHLDVVRGEAARYGYEVHFQPFSAAKLEVKG